MGKIYEIIIYGFTLIGALISFVIWTAAGLRSDDDGPDEKDTGSSPKKGIAQELISGVLELRKFIFPVEPIQTPMSPLSKLHLMILSLVFVLWTTLIIFGWHY